MFIFRVAKFSSLHPTHFCPALLRCHRMLWPRPVVVTRGRMGLYSHAVESSNKGISAKIQPVIEFSWSPAEFIWIRPLGFWWAASRMVAAIIVCHCDVDGRHSSSPPAKFDTLDALGFGEWGSRIPIPCLKSPCLVSQIAYHWWRPWIGSLIIHCQVTSVFWLTD